jgi:hypothetical protein
MVTVVADELFVGACAAAGAGADPIGLCESDVLAATGDTAPETTRQRISNSGTNLRMREFGRRNKR